MVHIENVLQESTSLYLTIRSCKAAVNHAVKTQTDNNCSGNNTKSTYLKQPQKQQELPQPLRGLKDKTNYISAPLQDTLIHQQHPNFDANKEMTNLQPNQPHTSQNPDSTGHHPNSNQKLPYHLHKPQLPPPHNKPSNFQINLNPHISNDSNVQSTSQVNCELHKDNFENLICPPPPIIPPISNQLIIDLIIPEPSQGF